MNETTTIDPLTDYVVSDYYVVAPLSSSFACLGIIISIFIIILIWQKSRLHTVNHTLIANTCFASIVYCIITIIQYVYLIFITWDTNDWHCRARAYFYYVGLAGVIYSYMIQAISRFFFSVLAVKYRWLISFKTHYILIGIQWLIVCLISSSTLITKDVYFRPVNICFIPMRNTAHTAYFVVSGYVVPVVITVMIYIYIFYKVKKVKRNVTMISNTFNGQKRDLELLRNIAILISIYLSAGVPTIIYFFTLSNLFFFMALVTISSSITVVKVCTILLDRELRQTLRNILCRRIRVKPFNNIIRPTAKNRKK